MIQLQTLGPLTVTANSRVVPCPRKAALPLVLLADRHQQQSKTLSAVLWPEADQGRALHSLNQALYTARRIVGKDGLVSDGLAVRLLAEIRWDYQEALQRLERGDVLSALGMIRGPFLQGISIENGDLFEEWREQKVAYLSSRILSAVRAEAGALSAARDWQQLNMLAQRAAQLFPDSSALQAERARALIGLGDVDDAKRVYDDLTAALAAGIPLDLPQGGLTSFDDLTRSVSVANTVTSRARSAFVGRANEIKQLEEALTLADAGTGNVVLLAGTAGIGKTAVCAAFASRAASRDTTLVSAAASVITCSRRRSRHTRAQSG
jgi:DNA-binding SARP family transcriptional activator